MEGFKRSRLPSFTFLETLKIHGTHDFLGLNHYSTWLVEAAPEAPIGDPSYDADKGTTRYQNTSWEKSEDSPNYVKKMISYRIS